MPNEILIVDDEKDIRSLVAGILGDEGFQTREAWDSDSAFLEIETRRPSLILLDIWLQGSKLDGLAILRRLRQIQPDLPVIMISGHGTIETAVSAIRLGAYDFMEKPFDANRLLISVTRAIEANRLKRENEELRLRAGADVDMIGQSHAMNEVRQAVERVSPTGSRVLISGPPGSGKEVLARLIHRLSKRRDGPFVVISAATMTPERMEDELFGVEAGVLAQDAPRKIGVFEQAHGGTLYIDEVADMPLETQGKILRVLLEQTFLRVGGTRRVQVDVRVISASNRDLAAEIGAKKFREDLYYRLNVVPIRMPALRERRDDIPALARHFMARAAEGAGLYPRVLGEDTLAVMQTCDWPGNVRQLRNVVEWLLIMAAGDSDTPIRAEMIPPELLSTGSVGSRAESSPEIMALPLREARELFERKYLQAQVLRFGNNISRTATFVGMERSALHRKLKTLGLTGDERS